MGVIPVAKQREICQLIQTFCKRDSKYDEERERLLFIGVLIALGSEALPPAWNINIQCFRTDRIVKDTLAGPPDPYVAEITEFKPTQKLQ